jgi:SMI1 / KNR4 family (SUKH-1)
MVVSDDRSNSTRLIGHWKSQGLAIAEGAANHELVEFEAREGVRIPKDFRAYLEQVNGMIQAAPDVCDVNLFAFWPLNRIKSIRDECPEYAKDRTAQNFFVFADYMIWSWAYAVEMNAIESEAGQVILVGGLRPQVVSRSFTEFVDLYIQDAAEIYAQP